MPELSSQPAIDLSHLAPGLGATCSGYLDNYRNGLGDSIRVGDRGIDVVRHHSRVLDGLLGALYCAADAAAQAHGGAPRGRVALVAVGGYGRGTVGLHSDVDVLFLCDDPSDPHVARLAEGLLYPLWDLGLDIGHAVRGVDETLALAREDIRTATTLIDLRRVGGDASIVEDLDHGGRRQVFEPHLADFLDALGQDTAARHERFGGSLYLLEPDVKQGRGGLRDLDVAEWAAVARWGVRSPEDYVRTGALLARELDELEDAREFLWRVRNLLHLRAKRQNDRLSFADQEEIAVELGFVDGISLAVEQFMQAYYQNARVVAQTAERMLDRARPRRRRAPAQAGPLGDGTMTFDGYVTFENTDALAGDPALALRLYRQVARQKLPPYSFARDAVARISVDAEWSEAFRASAEATDLFVRILAHVGDAPVRGSSLLGELHEVGLLLAMLPEFEPLMGRVQHDVYHVYTTDVHAVVAVDRLREMMRGERVQHLGMAVRLAAEAPRPVPLFLGVLLHDVGKAHGARDHRITGAAMARPIAQRLGLSPVDVEHVVWLVQEHASLYHWATRRDTNDPETIAEVARLVGNAERLRDLFLLTSSVMSTINPKSMTAWKARALEDLYIALSAHFDGAGEPAESRACELRKEAKVGFVGDVQQSVLEAFVDDMPNRYLLANPVDVVRGHARAARDRGHAKARVELTPGPSQELSELVVITDDHPGLLADVAAALAAHRLSIVSAQIYNRPRPSGVDEAFDVFLVKRDGRAVDGDDSLAAKVEADLSELLLGRTTESELFSRHPPPPPWAVRQGPDAPTEVVVDNDASARFTVVDVFTRDRPGLLHAIARGLHEHGVSIALAKVNTEGLRVADVFYVQDAAGGKVRDPARLEKLHSALREAVEAFHRSAEGEESEG